MQIVCSTNMPFVEEAFATLGNTRVIEGRAISATDVREAEILAIRSTTRVDAALLDGSRVRFVGTATIGTDHMDLTYLERRGIAWCYAPGSNANSVSEYIAAALLELADRTRCPLEGRCLGIIGVGNVGSRVARKARALGMRVLLSDPPRQAAEGPLLREDGARAGGPAVSLDELLATADAVTLHVPLVRDGAHPTRGMADERFFSRLRPGATFINSSRGSIMQTDALLAALASGRVAHAAVDTWEDEPAISSALLGRVDLATPHIAGYSFDGKVAGTAMVYQAACACLGRTPEWQPRRDAGDLREIALDARGRPDEDVIRAAVRHAYDVMEDDRALRESGREPEAQRARHFDALRSGYRERREFQNYRLHMTQASPRLVETLAALGFVVR